MTFRPALTSELDQIYLMGFDTWSGGKSKDDYLQSCHSSPKYKSGRWFVLADNDPVSSLLVHDFLNWTPYIARGIGSLATEPNHRERGYASELIKKTVSYLQTKENAAIIFLFADINPEFYRKQGFADLPKEIRKYKDSTLMAWLSPNCPSEILRQNYDKLPRYF